jgi:hypothetical protein
MPSHGKRVRFTRSVPASVTSTTVTPVKHSTVPQSESSVVTRTPESVALNAIDKIPMVVLLGADALAFLVALQQPSLINRYTLLGVVLGGIIITKEAYDEVRMGVNKL